VENHPYWVCKTALEMMEELKNVNAVLAERGLPPINIGAGINSDEVIVGNMGSKGRFEYSVIGDGVNLASRLEGLNKNYKTNIIISEFTKNRLDDTFLTRQLDTVKVKGKEIAVVIYELMANNERNKAIKTLYEKALLDYRNKRYAESKEGFLECYRKYGDETSNAFLMQHYHR
jgi:adenylate cyclase